MTTHQMGTREERDTEHGNGHLPMKTDPGRVAAGVGGCAPAASS